MIPVAAQRSSTQTLRIAEPLNPISSSTFPSNNSSIHLTNNTGTLSTLLFHDIFLILPPFSYPFETCDSDCLVQSSIAMAIALAEADKYEILEKIGKLYNTR